MNLAIADLLIGTIFIPLWVYYYGAFSIGWHLPQGYFPMVMEIIILLALFVSLITLVVIALERMFVVTLPFRAQRTTHMAYFTIIPLIWVVAAAGVAALMLTASMWIPGEGPRLRYIVLLLICILSILTISAAYLSIFIQMVWKNSSAPSEKEDRKLALTLLCMTTIAMITWTPYAVSFFVSVSMKTKCVFLFLNYSNAVINPIVYTLRTAPFRKGVKALFSRNASSQEWFSQSFQDCRRCMSTASFVGTEAGLGIRPMDIEPVVQIHGVNRNGTFIVTVCIAGGGQWRQQVIKFPQHKTTVARLCRGGPGYARVVSV